MKQLTDKLKSIIPYRVRSYLRKIHRYFIFKLAMNQFFESPEKCIDPTNPLLSNLIYGWGNESWSVREEYLAECIKQALKSKGPILECGSGLSTLLIGAIAKSKNITHCALENSTEWAEKLERKLKKYEINSLNLYVAPLKDYGDFCWYDPPIDTMPNEFSLIICDGPPGKTKGGRIGLVPTMRKKLKTGCVILLDDANRKQEIEIADSWSKEFNIPYKTIGTNKAYIKMIIQN